MAGNKYNCSPAGTPRTRLERLLRERELRKFNKQSLNDINGDQTDQLSTQDSFSPDSDTTSTYYNFFNDHEESPDAARVSFDGFDQIRQDFRASKQRLLVVANRLPVSAARLGDDSWQLEISVGGLVSALLGINSDLALSHFFVSKFVFNFFLVVIHWIWDTVI